MMSEKEIIDYQQEIIEKLKLELKNALIALKVKNNIPLWKSEEDSKEYIKKIIETL